MNVLTCLEVKAEMVSFLDGEASGPCAQAVRTHLASCEACAALAERHRAAGEVLAAYEGIEPREERTRAILAAAERAAGEESTGQSRPAAPKRARRVFARPLVLSAAATLLVAVTIGYLQMRPSVGSLEPVSPSSPVVQEIASDLDLYENLDDLLSPETASYLDLLAADQDLNDDDDDREN